MIPGVFISCRDKPGGLGWRFDTGVWVGLRFHVGMPPCLTIAFLVGAYLRLCLEAFLQSLV
jgi:hypothetical protein